ASRRIHQDCGFQSFARPSANLMTNYARTDVARTDSLLKCEAFMADHNDPNAVNHIFSDIDYTPADLYDLFGWPTDDSRNFVVALTFASAPAAGVLDVDLLYRLLLTSHPRVAWPQAEEVSVDSVLRYFDAVKDKYLGEFKTAEIRVTVLTSSRVLVRFFGFPCGDFSSEVDVN